MAKFDKTLDQILIAQMEMMDPEKRAAADIKKMTTMEKLQLLQNLIQGQTSDSARASSEGWMDTLVKLAKQNEKLPKKQRKRNRRFMAQVLETSVAVTEGWKTVAKGRAARAAKA